MKQYPNQYQKVDTIHQQYTLHPTLPKVCIDVLYKPNGPAPGISDQPIMSSLNKIIFFSMFAGQSIIKYSTPCQYHQAISIHFTTMHVRVRIRWVAPAG